MVCMALGGPDAKPRTCHVCIVRTTYRAQASFQDRPNDVYETKRGQATRRGNDPRLELAAIMTCTARRSHSAVLGIFCVRVCLLNSSRWDPAGCHCIEREKARKEARAALRYVGGCGKKWFAPRACCWQRSIGRTSSFSTSLQACVFVDGCIVGDRSSEGIKNAL